LLHSKKPAPLDEDDCLFMETLFAEYQNLMFRQAFKYFDNQSDVEDVVQQSLLKLIRYLPTIKNLKRNTLAFYIVNVIRSCSMDIYRKRKIERETNFSDFFEGFEENVVDDVDFDCLMEIAVSSEEIAKAILRLPEKDQFVLNAKYLMGWSDAEISSTLNMNKVTVRTRLYRAKRKVLNLLKGGLGEER